MEARALAGDVAGETAEILAKLGVEPELFLRGAMGTRSPITGETIGRVEPNDAASAKIAIDGANDAFRACRRTPAPRRGEFVRLLGGELHAAGTGWPLHNGGGKDPCGRLRQVSGTNFVFHT